MMIFTSCNEKTEPRVYQISKSTKTANQIIQDKKIRADDGWDNFMLWYHKEISKKTNTFSYEI